LTREQAVERWLAVFDVEGVLIPKRLYLLQQASKRRGVLQMFHIAFMGFLYEIGVFSLERALKAVYRLFAGVEQEEFYRTLQAMPLIPGVVEVFQRLKAKGYDIALISSGLPGFLVAALATRLGADYAYGIDLEVVDGEVTGKIGGGVIEARGKAKVLEGLLTEKGYVRERCLVVADDRNNLPMFPLAARTIGYNADALVVAACDYAVRGSLLDVLPFLETPVTPRTASYTRHDALREVIHMGSFLIPLLCHFFNVNRFAVAGIILATAVVYAFSELARGVGLRVPPFTTVTNLVAVGGEQWGFATAPLFFALGICVALTLVPPPTGFAAITILTLGDGTARLVGKKLGRRAIPYNKAKKLEGTGAGTLVAAAASLLFVAPAKAVAAAISSMVVETLPLPINDNLLIPLVAAAVLTLMP
jgi:HAD superfamily phosphoserine phosphatase-like hydrolase